MNILFICSGNTCRSPMAEGLCREQLKKRNITDITVSSAGLSAFPGDDVSENAVTAAKEFDADISAHRARQLSIQLVEETDLFVCMTESHAFSLMPFAEKGSIVILGNGISDPYGGDIERYRKCADEINEAIDKLLDSLKSRIILVPFEKSHATTMAEIEKSSFSSPWSEKSLIEELDNINSHFYVAKKGEEVLGYIGTQSICGECYITSICVDEKARRNGIGSRLIEKAVISSKIRNDEFISLEVRKSNETAIRLYKKFGFTVVGERKKFYRLPDEDAYIMTKSFKRV